MPKCGSIVIMGRPNAGKSTLLNALVGQKLAAVSAKPQTTRGRVRGIITEGDVQVLICDTPGLDRRGKGRSLTSVLNREAWSGLSDADVGVYLVSLAQGFRSEDRDFLAGVLRELENKPLILVGSQADRFKKREGSDLLHELNAAALDALGEEVLGEHRFVSLSAKRPEDLQYLKERFFAAMPEGPWLFPADLVSDQPMRKIAAELIREHVFRTLGQEVPYQTAAVIETWEEDEKLIKIQGAIVVARESLKALVIGKRGQKIKEIGTLSREALERECSKKVYLELTVIVSPNWIEDEGMIRDLHGID